MSRIASGALGFELAPRGKCYNAPLMQYGCHIRMVPLPSPDQHEESRIGILTMPLERSLRSIIAAALGHRTVKLSLVAARLDSSSRTVQRRLAELGIRYSDLHDDVRRERAIRLVTRGHMAMADIAIALGYHDAGSFTRAFRRWTGASPSQFRRANRRASDG